MEKALDGDGLGPIFRQNGIQRVVYLSQRLGQGLFGCAADAAIGETFVMLSIASDRTIAGYSTSWIYTQDDHTGNGFIGC
jgi:hypothetical protein